jgi:hypothetical protein
MSAWRPKATKREFTTGQGHELSDGPSLETRFASDLPAECLLDFQSQLERRGRPASAPGADRRLAVFSRSLWLARITTFGVGLVFILSLVGSQVLCLYRDYCFRVKPSTSPVAIEMSFPVAIVLMLVIVPFLLASLRLRVRELLIVSFLLCGGTAAALFIGGIWALSTLSPTLLDQEAALSYNSLKLYERKAYPGGVSESRWRCVKALPCVCVCVCVCARVYLAVSRPSVLQVNCER